MKITQIYNKRHEMLKLAALEDLKNPAIYTNHFDIHQVPIGRDNKEVLNIIIQEFSSILKLNEMKRQSEIIPFLRQINMRLSEYEWSADIWNTKVIGFLTKYDPSYFPKEYVYQRVSNLLKAVNDLADFKIRQIRVSTEVLGSRITIQVYAIEVKREDHHKAHKQFLKHLESPEEYISFRTQEINEKAFKNAVAVVAQLQSDTRAIVIENVSEDAYFILDSQIQNIDKTLGYFHLPTKQSVRIVVLATKTIKLRNSTKKQEHKQNE